MKKADYLKDEIKHVDIKSFDSTPIIRQYADMAFQARTLARAADIYDRMLGEKNCGIILCLAGSIFSAGLKKVVYDLVDNNMVDAIVSTGALIVDQDFFEGLGYKHYKGTWKVDDDELFKNHIDRIYDTFIDEDHLRDCDLTTAKIADSLPPKPYSSREFISKMGEYLVKNNKGEGSIVRRAYEKGVPIFVPAFSDCSAGFGLVYHQWNKKGKPKVSIDSVKDFLELTKVKLAAGDTGLFMISGGVPKNFAQDVVVAADVLGKNAKMHKYAVQITVADERDGGLSGSTLQEAHSWGKVDQEFEQMVYAEATLAVPLITSYAYHRGNWKKRTAKNFNKLLDNDVY
ncbi:MAG: deoxyhypusine synthase [Candidatus Micrarchaeota archaeon]